MSTDPKNDYINGLLSSEGNGLEGADQSLFTRLCQAKAEGDSAINGAARLRSEAVNLDGIAANRQGRFDTLADLLWEAYTEKTKTASEEKPVEPEAEATPPPPEIITEAEAEAITE